MNYDRGELNHSAVKIIDHALDMLLLLIKFCLQGVTHKQNRFFTHTYIYTHILYFISVCNINSNYSKLELRNRQLRDEFLIEGELWIASNREDSHNEIGQPCLSYIPGLIN